MKAPRILSLVCLMFLSIGALGQGNGKLQIHYMDVGQGDGALLISPNGETVLFDNGDSKTCDKPLAYLETLGITKIDYMIISHYHADHFGCTKQTLAKYPLTHFSYDRPGAYNSGQFRDYVAAVGSKRKQVHSRTKITLDAGTEHPVVITIAGYNGAGVKTDNENDRSVAAVIHFGAFDAMMAGDLSGYKKTAYKDIETPISKKVGQMEVYKSNHHGSEYSSNPTWLKKLSPRIAIVSAGFKNKHKHPTSAALARMRQAGIEKIYWTSAGNGGTPTDGTDVVANSSIVIQISPGADSFAVGYGSQTDTFSVWPKPYKGAR